MSLAYRASRRQERDRREAAEAAGLLSPEPEVSVVHYSTLLPQTSLVRGGSISARPAVVNTTLLAHMHARTEVAMSQAL